MEDGYIQVKEQKISMNRGYIIVVFNCLKNIPEVYL